jgi:hypothetical protein
VSVPDKAQVKFTLPDYGSSFGRMLTYDTKSGQWASHYSQVACSITGACVWQGYYTFANATALCLSGEAAGVFNLDFGLYPIPVIWASSKIHIGALGGFQRARRLVLKGAYSDDSAITILVKTDLGSYTATLASTDAIDSVGYFTLRHHFQNQKCQYLQLVITDTPLIGTGTYAGCNLTGITLGIAVKRGQAKLVAAAST